MSLRNEMSLAVLRVRVAQADVDFMKRFDLQDTTSMLESQLELRVAKAFAAVTRRKVVNELNFPGRYSPDRLETINDAAAVGFSLSV